MRSDCRYQALPCRARACLLAVMLVMLIGAAAVMPGAALAQPGHETPGGAPGVRFVHAGVQAAQATHAAAPHEQTLLQTIAKLANFAILAGVLVYFLKSPIAAYLASRATQIRQDLVTAAEMRATASAQLAEIARKLETLPAELEALTAQGAQDVVAEQARIAHAAAVERERLIEQTRREIASRLRLARRELTEHAAELAINIAGERIKRSITPDDQLRLVDRYTSQLSHRTHGKHGTKEAR